MIQLNSITLLTIYLKECSGFVESLLKRGLTASLNSWEKSLIQEIGHLANVLSVIYFYRKYQANIDDTLETIPVQLKNSIQENFHIIWEHISQLKEEEIADLAIETIQETNRLMSLVRF